MVNPQNLIDRLKWELEGKAAKDEYDRGYRDAIMHAIKIIEEEVSKGKKRNAPPHRD